MLRVPSLLLILALVLTTSGLPQRTQQAQIQRFPIEGPPTEIASAVVRTSQIAQPTLNLEASDPKKPRAISHLSVNEQEVSTDDESRRIRENTQFVAKLLDFYLANENRVEQFVRCIEKGLSCRNKRIVKFLDMINEIGTGGKCETCNPDEQKVVNELLYRYLTHFRTSYRTHFTRMLPTILHLVASA